MTSKEKIKLQIIEASEKIAEIISKENDVELRKESSGLKIIEIKKTVVK